MAARALTTLSISFGLVSIPVKVYSATDSTAGVRFKLMGRGGARLRQQFVADEPAPIDDAAEEEDDEEEQIVDEAPAANVTPMRSTTAARLSPRDASAAGDRADSRRTAPAAASPPALPSARLAPSAAPWPTSSTPATVERHEMVKGYEFEKGRFVLFTAAELKALAEGARQTIDIVAFLPGNAIDPVYYDKAYYLAPDKRGAKPYSLLVEAMRRSGCTALAKWAWRAKEYVVQIRPVAGGLVLQQLLYADEVRAIDDLDVGLVPVGDAELELALRLVAQSTVERYDPTQFVDEEKMRILAAVEEKIGEAKVVAHDVPRAPAAAAGGQVIDLVAALRASLAGGGLAPRARRAPRSAAPKPAAAAVSSTSRAPRGGSGRARATRTRP